ncbi:MAG: KTSC domain-containing protein [Ignavibacteriae bacterium]|nr:KTSC domain-containing protein [Ignavibacteriota bacterium]MCB9243491.1 KTSC domain-containing protein [Ignavibacteriales bacterium]
MNNIEMIDVRSSTIRSIGYDYVEEILVVEFKNRSIYEYYNVSEMIFQNFLDARSKGTYLGKHIRDKYKYKRIK